MDPATEIKEPSLIGIGQPAPPLRIRQPGRMMMPLLVALAVLLIGVAGAVSYLLVQTRDTLQARERELLLVNAERDDLKGQLAQTQDAKSRVEKDLARVRQDLSGAQEQLTAAIQERETLSRSLEEREQRITQLSHEADRLNAERQQLTAQVDGLQSEHQTIQRQLEELQAAKGQLESKLLELSDRPTVELDKVVVSGTDAPAMDSLPMVLPAVAPPPQNVGGPGAGLTGQVVVVNRDYDFIVMNLGRNHGVTVGQELKIVRESEELGRVKVEKIYDELSAAALLPESRKDAIKEGDTIVAL